MQIATSNRIYPIVIIIRIVKVEIDENHAVAQYTPTSLRTIWPALIFAASRNDRVAGRTKILVVSIRTKNGLSQSGAPSGRKWATDALGDFKNVDRIILSHRGRPRVRVKIRWLDVLNIYGINPIKLIKMIKENRGVIIVLIPLSLNINVRFNCLMITDVNTIIGDVLRFVLIQKDVFSILIISKLTIINILVDGSIELKTNGSNEEKMSVIIQNMDIPLGTLKVSSLFNLMFY